MKYSSDIVVLDLEATCPYQNNNEIEMSQIIDIGAVRLDRRTLREVDSFSELVNPGEIKLPEFITELTSITNEMLQYKETFDIVGQKFIEWVGPRNRFMLAVFGAYYDIPLLRKEYRDNGFEFKKYFVGGALDIRALGLAWLAERGKNTSGLTVERLLESMGIEGMGPFHRALNDARAEAAIFQMFHFGECVPPPQS